MPALDKIQSMAHGWEGADRLTHSGCPIGACAWGASSSRKTADAKTTAVSECAKTIKWGGRRTCSSTGRVCCNPFRPIDERTIRKIHRAAVGGREGGRYRQLDVWLPNRTTRRVCSAPPWRDVPTLMKGLGRWLAGATGWRPPVITASLAHLELVAIHPFRDGNGRTARALACLVLTRGGLVPGSICPETLFGEVDRTAYCEAIEAALGQDYEPGYDATPFVIYVITALSAALEHELSSIRRPVETGTRRLKR